MADPKDMFGRRLFHRNCPVLEHTADGVNVGRCWHSIGDEKKCRRHGDVRNAVLRYLETGELTNDYELEQKR